MKFKHVSVVLFSTCFLISCTNQGGELHNDSSVLESDAASNPLIFTVETNGGCMRMGPNCPRYELFLDGEFNVYRSDVSEAANNGVIDKELVNSWLELVKSTDFNDLQSRLGEGECKACFDGVDLIYTILPESKRFVLNSREYEFSSQEKFFKLSNQVIESMQQTAPLDPISRI